MKRGDENGTETGPKGRLVSGKPRHDQRTRKLNTRLPKSNTSPLYDQVGLHEAFNLEYLEQLDASIVGWEQQIEMFYQQGFIPYSVPGGGNSLFAAVVDQLRAKGEFRYTAKVLRESAVNYLRKHPIQEDGTPVSSFLTDESWEKYLNRMTLDTEYGDQIIIRALADVLQRPIVLLGGTSAENQTVILPQRHRPKDYSQQVLVSGSEGSADQSDTRHMAPVDHFVIEIVTPSRQESLFLGQIDETQYISLRTEEWEATLAESLRKRRGPIEENRLPLHHLNFFFKYIFYSNFIIPRDTEFLTTLTEVLAYSKTLKEYVGPRADRLVSAIKPIHNPYLLPTPSRPDARDTADIPFSVIVTPIDTVVRQDFGQRHNSTLLRRRPFDLLMHNATCPNGHVKLKPVDPSHWQTALFVDEERLQFVRHLNVLNKEALQASRQTVLLGFISQWPPEAKEWTTRHRPSGWPAHYSLSWITSHACRIVPVASRDSIYPNTEWSFNFDIGVRFISVRLLSSAQRSCFQCLFQLVTSKLQEKHGTVYSILQHIFFYACEQIEATTFEKEPGTCVKQILKQLNQHLVEQQVPHYFMKNENLIQKMPSNVVKQLQKWTGMLSKDPTVCLYFLLEKYGHTMPTTLGRLLESTVDDARRFSVHGQLDQTFMDLIVPEYIKLVQECLFQQPVNYLTAKTIFQETLERLEKQSKTATSDLAEQLFRKVKAGLPDMTAWCMAFYLSETMQFGKVLFDVVCDGQGTRAISEVFGSEFLDFILTNDVEIPISFTVEPILVYLTLQFVWMLGTLERDKAVLFLMENFMANNSNYIHELAGKSEIGKHVGDKIAYAYGYEVELYNALLKYQQSLHHLGKGKQFLAHMETFEALADQIQQTNVYRNISRLWVEYGFPDRAQAALQKANSMPRLDLVKLFV